MADDPTKKTLGEAIGYPGSKSSASDEQAKKMDAMKRRMASQSG